SGGLDLVEEQQRALDRDVAAQRERQLAEDLPWIAGREDLRVARVALEVQLDELAVRHPCSVANQPGLADLPRAAQDQRAALPRAQPGQQVLCTRSFQRLMVETTRCFFKYG